MKTANFSVYLQALGGKFLGPNAYNTDSIQITLQYSGGSLHLPYQLTPSLNDGEISQEFSVGTSTFMPILTMPAILGQNPVVNYLTANVNTIVGNFPKLNLPSTNEEAKLTVSIPTPSGIPLLITQSVLLLPEQLSYKIVVVVPGLLLTPNDKTNKNYVKIPNSISVFVNMMCGCKVTQRLATSFWSSSDFIVNAAVLYNDGSTKQYVLSFNAEANNSLFSAAVTDVEKIHLVKFTAQQLSTGNYGALSS